MTDDASVDLLAALIVRHSASIDLNAAFWIARYPAPLSIEDDQYGAILIIDPRGLRADNRGPIEFLMDSTDFRPGITAKTGFMTAELNDNDNSKTGPAAHTDMYLIREGTELIRDDDEFWIGVQRGPLPGGNNPIGSWNPTGGSDGKGSGRKLLMGGFVSQRFHTIENKKITATIVGKDYMDIWNDQPYGSALIPKEYAVAQDVGFIVEDIINTINSLQTAPAPLRPDGWYYYPHPIYWPTRSSLLTVNASYTDTVLTIADVTGFQVGDVWVYDDITPAGEYPYCSSITPFPLNQLNLPPVPGITNIPGYHVADNAMVKQSNLFLRWSKTFKQDPARDIMAEICDESLYEWTIDYLRYVRLFPRGGGPIAPNIRYGENVRSVPKLLMGDTTERITHLIAEGITTTIPAASDLWCATPSIWHDPTNTHRSFARYSFPPPSNPIDQTYTDVTLIQDDQGQSALCFQNDNVWQFNLNFGMKIDALDNYIYPELALDLREIRRLKFKFRHATYDGTPGSVYRIHIRCRQNDGWYFNFGQGIQEALGVSNHDTIDSADWTEIDLLLPECDEAGSIIDLHGFILIDDPATPPPDPTEINWPAIFCSLAEANPGRGPGQNIYAAAIGDNHIHVNNPQQYIGLAAASPVMSTFLYQPQEIELVDGAATERITVSKIDTGILYLTPPDLTANWNPTAKAHVRAGWTICFSQFRFERQLHYEASGVLAPPYRYRVLATNEAKKLTELISRSDGILQIQGDILYGVDVVIDGDPQFEIGSRPRVYFGLSPYQNLRMVIDEAAYHLVAGDFWIDLSLGLIMARSTRSSDLDVLAAHEKQLRDIKSSQDLPRGDE